MKVCDWTALDERGRDAVLARPAVSDDAELQRTVGAILDDVARRGDEAVRDYTRRFDGVELADVTVGEAEFDAAATALDADEIAAIELAVAQVRRFHESQRPSPIRVETAPGVVCERLPRPLDSVGLYVPAGTAPLPSAAVMLSVPAILAGCPNIVLATPPRPDGRADPAVLVAAASAGVRHVVRIGGAQAIAAMAFGTASVPRVVKLFGPGNAYVTAAKSQVAARADGAAIDMPAGPSELMVIADATASAEFVAADLLSQAEHGPDSQVLLVTPDGALATRVAAAVQTQLKTLPRRDIAAAAIAHAAAIVTADLEACVAIANRYAPEHLIVQTAAPEDLLGDIRNAGSVFLGRWTPESVGDYMSGTNHVLPTYGHARAYSGLGVDQFVRQMTVQSLTAAGLGRIGPATVTLARLEQLEAHARAVTLRLAAADREESAA
ncbi:MAG: histidinol dehydrogenase [Pseudomonadota bacterium]